jgi:hypothetical protein
MRGMFQELQAQLLVGRTRAQSPEAEHGRPTSREDEEPELQWDSLLEDLPTAVELSLESWPKINRLAKEVKLRATVMTTGCEAVTTSTQYFICWLTGILFILQHSTTPHTDFGSGTSRSPKAGQQPYVTINKARTSSSTFPPTFGPPTTHRLGPEWPSRRPPGPMVVRPHAGPGANGPNGPSPEGTGDCSLATYSASVTYQQHSGADS